MALKAEVLDDPEPPEKVSVGLEPDVRDGKAFQSMPSLDDGTRGRS